MAEADVSDEGAIEQSFNRWAMAHGVYRDLHDDVIRALTHAAFKAGFKAGLVLAERRAHPPDAA